MSRREFLINKIGDVLVLPGERAGKKVHIRNAF